MTRFFSLLLLFAVALTTACKRTTIIPDEELAMIFRDAFLTNAYIDHKAVRIDSLNLYTPIFAHYGYTTEDVQLTIGNFSKRKSARLGDVVERAIEMLEEEGLKHDLAVTKLDTIRNVAVRTAERIVLQDSLIRVRTLKDSVRLQFSLPAEVGEYELTYEFRIDSLDKNKRLYRRTWIERNDSTQVNVQINALARNRDIPVTRKITTDSTAREVKIHLLTFPESPKRPSITVRDLKVTFSPPERHAIEQLYEKQLGIRIFADEFIRAACEKDSIQ